MISVTKNDDLYFVLRGKNRREVIKCLLDGSRTPSEIRLISDIQLSNVCRTINDLKERKLVSNCLSKDIDGTLIQLTDRALDFKEEFLDHLRFKQGKIRREIYD